jgi:hypothetical protein
VDNNVILNGLDADNPMSEGFHDATDKTGMPVPSPDAIKEFKVPTGRYDAEFGKQGCGTVNIVTRSGDPEYHGSAIVFFRNTTLMQTAFSRTQRRCEANLSAEPVRRHCRRSHS